MKSTEDTPQGPPSSESPAADPEDEPQSDDTKPNGDEDGPEKTDKLSFAKGWPLFKRLWPYLRPELGLALVIGAMTLVALPAAVASPFLVRKIFDELVPQGEPGAVVQVAILIAGLTLFAQGLGYLQHLIGLKLHSRIRFRLTRQMFDHVLRLPVRYFHKHETGYLMSRLRDDVTALESLMPDALVDIVINVGKSVLFLTLLWLVDPGLAFSGFVLVAAIFGVVIALSPALRRRSEAAQEADAKSSSALHESITGLNAVRLSAREPFERRRVSGFVKTSLRAMVRREVLGAATGTLVSSVGVLGMYVILAVGAYRIMTDASTIGNLISFFLFLTNLMGSTGTLFGMIPAMQRGFASLERIYGILDEDVEPQPGRDRTPPRELNGVVSFRGVSFAYEGEANAVEDIDLEVGAGEVVAIVGRSGAGKSTLVSLVPRLYLATRGEILIDGVSSADYPLRWLRRRIGVVPQDVFLFNRSIRDNIGYALDRMGEEELERSARSAHAHEFIQKLPNGYDTFIGERGVRLSGGEKQRLAIAREILRDPPILILDEATSSLDSESEALIQDAMKTLMKNRTCFVIAHRLSTIQGADRIVVMDEGRIREVGTHAELIEREGGLYRMLHARQSLDGQGAFDRPGFPSSNQPGSNQPSSTELEHPQHRGPETNDRPK